MDCIVYTVIIILTLIDIKMKLICYTSYFVVESIRLTPSNKLSLKNIRPAMRMVDCKRWLNIINNLFTPTVKPSTKPRGTDNTYSEPTTNCMNRIPPLLRFEKIL